MYGEVNYILLNKWLPIYDRPTFVVAESTDDVSSGSEGELPLLPDFFSHKHFMLYGEIGAKTRRLLIRYITAYNGLVLLFPSFYFFINLIEFHSFGYRLYL